MANFNTHLSIALAVSSSLATAGLMFGVYGFFEMILLAVIGMIGGLLPDIDLDKAKISQMAFTVASVFGASFFSLLIYHSSKTSLDNLMIIWGVLVLVLKFVVFGLFSKFTRHRGMVHSVPYMAVLALLFVWLAFFVLGISDKLSWLFGVFLFIGSIVHLILDEIYSVNIYGLKVKKSFGTALKFFESKKPLQYAILYLILVGLWVFSPSKMALLQALLPVLGQL